LGRALDCRVAELVDIFDRRTVMQPKPRRN
jgi:hypothetical protein